MYEEKIESILSDIAKVLPQNAQQLKKDLEKNLRETLNIAFSKMELVTREEFDIQTALLQRTRLKLDEMKNELAQLEKNKSQ